MARLNRIGNTEKLIIDLRNGDFRSQRTLRTYGPLMHELSEYAAGGEYADEVMIAIGNLIEEAMERE